MEQSKYSDLLTQAISEKRDFYPLSQSQLGIYLECAGNPGTTMYNIPYSFAFPKSDVRLDRLVNAVKAAILNHEILFCSIAEENGEIGMKLRQSLHSESKIEIHVFKTSESDVESEIQNHIKPFDMEKDLLFNISVFETETHFHIFMDFHHIVFDGTSIGVLSREIENACNGAALEKESLCTTRLGLFEQKLEEENYYDEGKEFFKKSLSGLESKTMLLPDVNVEAENKNASFSFNTKGILCASDVEKFNGGKGIGAFFIATFSYAIAKFLGQEESVIYTPNHGRNEERMKNAIGMMVRTLPIYTKIDETQTIAEFLSNAKSNIIAAIKNGNYPFTKLAQEYDLSMDIDIAYQGDSFNKISIDGKDYFMKRSTPRESISPFTLMIFKEGDYYNFHVFYRADLYTQDYIKSFLEFYAKVVSEFLKKEKLCEIEFLTENQKTLLDTFNKTETEYDRTKTVVDLFREQAAKNPEKTAVVYLDKKFTYRQVDELSDKIASYINSLGIGKEDVVSILISRSEWMPIAAFGVLKSGAAYQPLDPTYPKERLEFMIKDSSAKLLICDESLRDLVSAYTGEVLLTKDISSLTIHHSPLTINSSQDLFILLYTSGTTGTPKGAMLEHGNIAAFCAWYKRYYNLTEESKVAAYASFGFDANMMDTYPILTSGGELHIIPEDMRLDIVAMNNYLEKNKISHSFMTTQVGRAFATSLENKSLLHFSTGGEALSPIEISQNYKFHNLYGPTECTVLVTAFTLDKVYKKIPIGKATDNIKLYIIDKFGRRLPVGASGELCVAGHQVSRGYLNRPEQTEKVFTKNPFSDEKDYGRVYRTGDVVRYLPDGNIDFVGRNDGQVKIRGFRIELTEVEKIIREFSGIKDATVAAFDDAAGGKFIAAYIVSDEKIDIAALNDFIAANKPPYMVPAVTTQIEKIPLNVNGKVDKRKLPKPDAEISPRDVCEANSVTTHPVTALEEKILGIIESILGRRINAVSENLLRCGFTSLSVIRFAVALNKEFGFEPNVKKLMKGCSVISIENEIVDWLLNGGKIPTEKTVIPIRSEASSGEVEESNPQKDVSIPPTAPLNMTYPLSSSQFGVYADTMRNPTTTLYNIPMTMSFSKSADAEKLRSAVQTVLLAHPYIFTHLAIEGDDIVQVREAAAAPEIPIMEMSCEEFDGIKKGFVQPFDLMRSPLFRFIIVKTPDAINLLCDFHHIIFDGASLDIFMKQLKTVLEGGEIESETFTSFDYIEGEQKFLKSDDVSRSEKIYSEMLSEFESASEIPSDLNGKAENGEAAFILENVNHDALSEFAKSNDLNVSHIYMAAVSYAICRFVNSRNVYINTISNGRSNVRLSESFGMFVKTIPLVAKVEDVTVLEFIESVGESFGTSMDNEMYPYNRLCSKFGYAPEIMFEYQLGVIEDFTVNGEAVNISGAKDSSLKFKVDISVVTENGKPSLRLQYNNALYSDDLMKTLLSSIKNALENMVANPASKIRKISLLNETSLKKIKSFSVIQTGENENHLMHEGFEKYAKKDPDHTAIIACDKKLTYGEMDRLANIAANALIKKGLKPKSRVLVLLDRNSKFFVSELAVLKAGCAYIPSVTDYPKERIDTIIEDSGAAFVITEGELLSVYKNTVDVNELLAGSDERKPSAEISPDSEAYLIYTSGSTGKPKGVILRHEGVANYLTDTEINLQVTYPKKYGHVFCNATTLAFDMSVTETWGPLNNGLTLAFADNVQQKDPVALAKFMKENNVDIFSSTPSRILEYMELPSFAEALKNCTVIHSGGEKYPDKLLKLMQKETKARLIDTYGPTEITVASSVKDLTNAAEITTGTPLYNCMEYVVDSDDNLLPVGVMGELIIAGKGVALGYNNLPEQTKKAFIEFDGKRAYRSGDYARWTKNGEVAIIGRLDNQVKLRGLRIELDEIQKRLSDIEGIKMATVLIRKIGNQDALCAYFTADKEMDENFIKQELKKSLTDYMIPTSYNQLDAMPLSPSGKINAKELPAPVAAKRSGREAKNATEKTLCEVFAKTLSLDTVFPTDSFFDLGGSSLSVTRLVIAAEKAGFKFAYADVFSHPTPESLALLATGGEEKKSEFEDLGNYDYTKINEVLAKNTLENFKAGKKQELGDVLLTGATGFLGIHVLYELLHSHSGKVFCLLRGKGTQSAKQRLNGLFFYYFDEIPSEIYKDRLEIIEGDITNPESFEKLTAQLSTVINCAANVKHFSKGNDIERVNYDGVLNILDFCKKTNANLVQISTMSVSGMSPKEGMRLHENELYIGQHQISKYTQSKYMAERAILQAAAEGLGAKIMRVGNLSARDKDGEFQMNFKTNSFMGRLKSAYLVGKTPFESLEQNFELSPIDYVAKSILLLAASPKECVVFHPYNNHPQMMADLYGAMNSMDLKIEAAENDEYKAALEKAMSSKKTAEVLSSIIAYQGAGSGFSVEKENSYTMQVLYRLGFNWPATSKVYMRKFIGALKTLGFFYSDDASGNYGF